MNRLEDLLEGGPHRRDLYRYLDELRRRNPTWLVGVGGSPPDGEYIFIREGVRGASTVMFPLLLGREYLTERVLRRALTKVDATESSKG